MCPGILSINGPFNTSFYVYIYFHFCEHMQLHIYDLLFSKIPNMIFKIKFIKIKLPQKQGSSYR